MLRVNASTAKPVPDARKLVIRMIRVPKHSNALTVENVILHIEKKCSIYKRRYDIQSIRVSKNVSFFEACTIYQKTHGQRAMSYAGAAKPPIQGTSVCTQTDVSWVGAQPVTRKQRPAASVTSRPVPSVSRSVGIPLVGRMCRNLLPQQDHCL